MDSRRLARRVAVAVRDQLRDRLGLCDPRIDYLPNAGGFVNASFRLVDGTRLWHLKVARDPDAIAALRRWSLHADRLASRYLAPRLLSSFVPTEDTFGLVFEWIQGSHPAAPDPSWVSTLQPALSRLHADDEWAAQLDPGPARQAIETYRSVFLERFATDLDAIRRAPPPFVRRDTLTALRRHVDRLTAGIERDEAFQTTVHSPIHADLWRNNVLVSASGRVVILDWDDLTVGDPALDWSLALCQHAADFSLAHQWLPDDLDGAARRRVDAYAQAIVLDVAIDALADWIEAVDAPQRLQASRALAEAEHRRAVACLRRHHAFDDGAPVDRA